MGNITHRIFLSQTYLAYKLGLCRATINRALKKLAELNLIQKIDRGWKEERTRIKKTCYYIISRLFDVIEIRRKYAHKFKSLLYAKIISNFESFIASGFKHYDRIVTGIKYFSNNLFKNTDAANNSIKFLRRRRLLKGERLKQDSSITIIERDRVMSQFTLPRVLEEAAFLNLAAKMDLAVFNEVIIQHAFAKLAVSKDISRPYAYVKGICKSESTKRQLSLKDRSQIPIVEGEAELDMEAFRESRPSATLGVSAGKQFKEKNKQEEKRYVPRAEWKPTEVTRQKETAMEIANNLAKAAEMLKAGNEFARYAIKGISEMEYQTTGEEGEDLAIQYINKKKKEFESAPSLAERLKELGMAEEPELPKKDATPQRDMLLKMLREQQIGYTVESKQEPSNLDTPTNVNPVATPDNLKNEPGSITINETDYDEVLD
jgi:predicted transcriptional regulator